MMTFEEEFDDKSESDEVSIQMTILKMGNSIKVGRTYGHIYELYLL